MLMRFEATSANPDGEKILTDIWEIDLNLNKNQKKLAAVIREMITNTQINFPELTFHNIIITLPKKRKWFPK